MKAKRGLTAVYRNLVKTRALLAERASWIKGEEERKTIGPSGKVEKVQYCLLGALRKADGAGEQDAMRLIGDVAVSLYPKRASHVSRNAKIFTFNDHNDTRHSQVLRVLDAAIKEVSTDG